jgi:hypothetical protein
MFRTKGSFTILRFGYEFTIPEVSQIQGELKNKKVLNTIRHAPDFVLASREQHEVYLVEVKYRSYLDGKELLRISKEAVSKWNPSWLFVATPAGFYFSPCNTIVNEKGKIDRLPDNWIPSKTQELYLSLLNEFERCARH